MTENIEFTTEEHVKTYVASSTVFPNLLREVRELSKKKPEATISVSKVKIINRVLTDLLGFLQNEPTGKYLELLDNEALPQISDAVLIMVQFQSSLESYENRYLLYIRHLRKKIWMTPERMEAARLIEEGSDED
jgi:hypothetical protein